MSSTRRATDGCFHQERYCSGSEFERGIMANLTAKRCEALTEAEDRELVWAVQFASHREGLDRLAADLVARFPDRVKTAPDSTRGRLMRQASIARLIAAAEQRKPLPAEAAPAVQQPPRTEDAATLQAWIGNALAELCTNPAPRLAEHCPHCFPDLIESLRLLFRERAKAQRGALVETVLSKAVFEGLDFVLLSGGMAVLDGAPLRIGKSFAARTWCELHGGKARFVQVPASNDDISFFRAISQALGVAAALSLKGVQMRERIEVTLRSSNLMLALDDAHYLWPQNNRREALPNRLNWLLTALVNHGTPVALLTTPQFAGDQRIVEKKTGWTSQQFFNVINDYRSLPRKLSRSELEAIAAACLPTANQDSISQLANYAFGSRRYLSAIEAALKRSQFLSASAGRDGITAADVHTAINKYVMPGDLALKAALGAEAQPAAISDSVDDGTELQDQQDGPAERLQPLAGSRGVRPTASTAV
jgi:hypothetical protein